MKPFPARLRLFIHRCFFATRHFWVTSLHSDVPGTWCFECGTLKDHSYLCDQENTFRQRCQRVGNFPNCIEIVEALLFVRHPEADKATLCDWCTEQVRKGTW